MPYTQTTLYNNPTLQDEDDFADDAPAGGFALRRFARRQRELAEEKAEGSGSESGEEGDGSGGDSGDDKDDNDSEGDSEGEGDDDDDDDDEEPEDSNPQVATAAMRDDLQGGLQRLKRLGVLEKMGIEADDIASGSEEDEEDDDVEGDESDDEDEDEDEDDEGVPETVVEERRERPSKKVDAEEPSTVPFAMDAPTTWAGFNKVVKSLPPAELKLVISRIRTCNAIRHACYGCF